MCLCHFVYELPTIYSYIAHDLYFPKFRMNGHFLIFNMSSQCFTLVTVQCKCFYAISLSVPCVCEKIICLMPVGLGSLFS